MSPYSKMEDLEDTLLYYFHIKLKYWNQE